MANLLMHCGGRHVSRDDIVNAPTPQRTRTWVPVPHHRLLDLVETTIDGQGYRVTSQTHGLWGDHGDRYFGLMELANGYAEDDYGLVLGLRNSHDKSFPASLALGSQVLVCDNLSFFGEVVLTRRHTHKTARHKLNEVYFLGALLIAGLVGAIFESWTVFLIAAGVLIVSSVHDGDIRI